MRAQTHGVGQWTAEITGFLCSRLGGLRRLLSWRPVRVGYALPSGIRPQGSPPGLWKWNFWEPGSPLSSCTAPPQLAGRAPRGWQGAPLTGPFSGLAHRCSCVWAASAGSCGVASSRTTARPGRGGEGLHPHPYTRTSRSRWVGPGAGAGPGRTRGAGARCPHPPLCPPQVTELRGLSSLAVGAGDP